MADPTLSTVMAKLATIELEQQEQTGLLASLVAKGQLLMSAVTDLAALLNTATTAEADHSAALSAKIDAANAKIVAVGTELQSLFDRLQAAGVSQADLQSIQDSIGKISTNTTVIDQATTAVDAQAERLTSMASDPTNPVPTPAPPVA